MGKELQPPTYSFEEVIKMIAELDRSGGDLLYDFIMDEEAKKYSLYHLHLIRFAYKLRNSHFTQWNKF